MINVRVSAINFKNHGWPYDRFKQGPVCVECTLYSADNMVNYRFKDTNPTAKYRQDLNFW